MYDCVIIGGGPAGYVAAERLGAAKKKVLLVESVSLGGTCLNIGCVPTKTLLNSAKQYTHAKEADKFGVNVKGVTYDWGKIQAWKNEVVAKLCAGVAASEKRCGVEVLKGTGEIVSVAKGGEKPAIVKVIESETMRSARSEAEGQGNESKTKEYETRTVLVCAGSVPAMPPIPGSKDNPKLVDSTGLLAIKEVPKKLVVIGGGVIGIEFAGLFSALGSEVTIVEMLDEIVPNMDREIAPLYRKALSSIKFNLGCKVTGIKGGTVEYTTKDGGGQRPHPESVTGDTILMAVGRRAVLQGWGAEAAGVGVTPKGVTVDDRMRTNIPGIWAAGDVTGLMQLAHAAYRQGEVAVADIIASLDGTQPAANVWRNCAVPWAVYGAPEAAGVGITEQEAAAKGIAIIKKTIPMIYSGRFVAENTFAAPGVVKVIADAKSRVILGVHALGAYASEFIWGGAALIEQEFRVEDVKQLIFPHPTVSELIRDVVWEL